MLNFLAVQNAMNKLRPLFIYLFILFKVNLNNQSTEPVELLSINRGVSKGVSSVKEIGNKLSIL